MMEFEWTQCFSEGERGQVVGVHKSFSLYSIDGERS